MGKSGLYPICLILMIGSCILYQFIGNPLDYTKSVTVPPQSNFSAQIDDKDIVSTLEVALEIAKENGLDNESPLAVTLYDGVWSISSQDKQQEIKVDKKTGQVLNDNPIVD